MFLAGTWKYAVCIGGRNPISLSLEGRFRGAYRLANEPHGTVCLHSSERDEKFLFILHSGNTSLETSCVSNVNAFFFQLFRWIEASS